MREDKALLPFGNFSTLAEFQYQRLQPLFDTVYIASKVNKFSFQASLIIEYDERSSPLVALASIWESIKVDEVFVLSVDTPFVSSHVIERLYTLAMDSHAEAIVARSNQGIQPLCAIYRRKSYPTVNSLMQEERHKLHGLLEQLDVKEVFFEEEKLFMNLNYPSDYQEALKHLQKG